jgi:hypothetical protein
MSDHAMRKSMTINTRQAHRKATSKSHKNQTHENKWVRLENHIATPVMRCEQPKSMSHMFSKPPSIINIGQEGVDGSVLG